VIRVWIAAASPLVRAGLEATLRSDDGLEIVDDEGHADVIVTDSFTPEARHEQGVVALGADTAHSLRAGAQAALPANALPEQIAAAVHAVAAGLSAALPDDFRRALPASAASSAEHLTAREIQVVRLMADGLANKEIAWELGISEHTVKFHAASIMNKLNAASRTEAVATAIRHGLVPV
jgi:DNA-binding NarL/FixJ family response regulator